MIETDVIVVGGGAVGENVVDRIRQGGLECILVEADLVGGECSYWACMPSKALLRSAEVLDLARRVPGAREAATGELDVAAVLHRRDAFTSHWDDAGQVKWVEGTGATLVRGYARLTGERTVTVEGPAGQGSQEIRARHAVCLSTGSTAATLPVFVDVAPWDSRQATSAQQVPGRLAIVGGGVVAVEMACAWNRLGSTVTMILIEDRILTRHEPVASALVQQAMQANGITVLTSRSVTSATRDGAVTLVLDDATRIVADEVLVAAGRRPATTDLGVELVGLEPGRTVGVDEAGRVPGVDWLWACGDLTGRALLTHQGKYAARAVGDAIVAVAKGEPLDDGPWGRHATTADHHAVPGVVFCDPELASVGLTEAAAVAQGLQVRAVTYEIGQVAGAAVYADDYQGWAKLVLDVTRGVVIGVTLVGPGVGDLLHAATVMVVGEVPIARLWHAVPSYPTLSEVWLRLLEQLGRDTA
jgi:pyruvate/2-oxoglutarate dehydrogenase complex dihydrolipoamide dehydrogenase (E3) component